MPVAASALAVQVDITPIDRTCTVKVLFAVLHTVMRMAPTMMMMM